MYRLLQRFTLLALICIGLSPLYGQTGLPAYKQQIIGNKTLQKQSSTKLLLPAPAPITLTKTQDEITAGSYFRADASLQQRLIERQPQSLGLELPTADGKSLSLTLVPGKVFSDDFQLYHASNPNVPAAAPRASFFWGIVNGDLESAAAVAITDGEVSGVISYRGTTYNLGRVEEKGADGLHVLYRAADNKQPPVYECFADEMPDQLEADTRLSGKEISKDASNCVRMYVEVDYDITSGKGGATQAADYVAAVFNQVAIMYANEAIDLTVSEMLVWDVQDPYTGSSSTDFLYAFRDRLNGSFNGDLAHLVGYGGGGGVAYLNQVCGGFYRVGYSGIRSTFNEVPTYSWTVEVVTHEIGHNLGSPHTHNCSWNGNGTAIDGCGPAAGYSEGCNAPVPAKGTVMSYCHLVSGVGIDLALGFGPQPGDLIRDRVYNGSCLTACGPAAVNDAGITAITSPSGAICESSVAPVVTLKNFGSDPLTSVSISYQINGGAAVNTAWTGNLASGASTSVTLTATNVSAGAGSLSATVASPNGSADEDGSNDSASGSFSVEQEQTFYADADGDGFGNPAASVIDCTAPAGYVSNADDCNDNDGSAFPGAPCSNGDACIVGETLDANCNCGGGSPSVDSDGDGVCDGEDVCPGGDDTIDTDGNGVPDDCDCNVALADFPVGSLTHSGNGNSSTIVSLPSNSKDPSFVVSGLGARLGGNPRNRYEERVVVTYEDGNGTTRTYGSFNGGSQSSVSVNISGAVSTITVTLSDGYDGNAPSGLSVDLSQIDYCAPFVSCPDADNDGTCDVDDTCPGLDNRTIGQPCDDGDGCTENDVITEADCGCAGTPIAGCVACDSEVTDNFSTSTLNHSGGGASSTSVTVNGNTGASFTVSGLNARTGGKKNGRFNEIVDISYVDASGNTVNYGSFSGASQGSVNVTIAGAAQSITVSLRDGESNGVNLSVSLSAVTSCASATIIAGSPTASPEVALFPNPTAAQATLRLGVYQGTATVIVRNMLGAVVREYRVNEAPALILDTREWAAGQVYLITLRREGLDPVTKRLVVSK